VGGGSTSRILLMSRLIIADDMEAGVRVGVAVGLDVVGARRSLHNVNLDSTACRRQLAPERLPTTHSQAMIQCDDGSWMHNVAVRASVHTAACCRVLLDLLDLLLPCCPGATSRNAKIGASWRRVKQ